MEYNSGPDPLLLLRKVLFQMASELGAIPGHSVFLKVADEKYGSSYYGTANLMKDYLGDGVKVQGRDNSFLTKTDIDCMFERLQPARMQQSESRSFDSNVNKSDLSQAPERSEQRQTQQNDGSKTPISKPSPAEGKRDSQSLPDHTFSHHKRMEFQPENSQSQQQQQQHQQKECHSEKLPHPHQRTEATIDRPSNQRQPPQQRADRISDQSQHIRQVNQQSQDSQRQHRRDSQSDERDVIEIDNDVNKSDSFRRESDESKSDSEQQIARISYSINRKQDIARERREKNSAPDRQLAKRFREDVLSDSERYLHTSYSVSDNNLVTDGNSSGEDRHTAGVPLRIENVMSLSQIVVPVSLSNTQSAGFSEPSPQPHARNSHSEVVQGFAGAFSPTRHDEGTLGVATSDDLIRAGNSASPPSALADRIATTQFSMSKNLVFRSQVSHLTNSYEAGQEESNLKMCRLCGKYFSSQPLLSAHIRSHRKHGEKPYECDKCSVKCVSVYNLKLHKERVHSGSEKSFHCPCCSKKFRLQIDLNNHFRHYCKVKKLATQMKKE